VHAGAPCTEGNERSVATCSQALDADGSGDVDIDELRAAWRAWFGAIFQPVRALIIIDVQNDFIDGTLGLKNCPAGQDAARVVPVCIACMPLIPHGYATPKLCLRSPRRS
jgi:hypothetical protein